MSEIVRRIHEDLNGRALTGFIGIDEDVYKEIVDAHEAIVSEELTNQNPQDLELRAENQRLREALEKYANSDVWHVSDELLEAGYKYGASLCCSIGPQDAKRALSTPPPDMENVRALLKCARDTVKCFYEFESDLACIQESLHHLGDAYDAITPEQRAFAFGEGD